MQNNINELLNETEEILEEEITAEQGKKESILKSEKAYAPCTWADDYFKKKRRKKIIKGTIICGLASWAAAGASCMLLAGFRIAQNNILDKNNYNQANEQYQQEIITDFAGQLSNNEITFDEYQSKIEGVKDLDKKIFLKENASEEDLKKYNRLDVAYKVDAYTLASLVGVGMLGFGFGGGMHLRDTHKENERNRREARIYRLLGR